MKHAPSRTLRHEVIALIWPAIMQGLLSTMILFTDRLILGRYDDSALASMQVCGPVLWSIFSLFGAYGVGVLAVIGRATGENNTHRAQTTMGTALCIALAMGALVGTIGHFSTPGITNTIVGSDLAVNAKDMANTYLGAVFLSGPLMMLTAVNFTAFQASGDTKTPMWLTGIGGVINLALSTILVFGLFGAPEMGIMGAAIGTIASSATSAGLGIYQLQSSPIRPKRPERKALNDIMNVAWPALGEKLLFHIGFLIFTAYVGRLGEMAMTAHQALMAIESLGFIAANGFGIAAAAIAAQKLGASRPDEAEKGVQLAAKMGISTLCLIGVIFFIGAEDLIGLFTQNDAVITLGASCMIVAAVSQPLMAISDVYGGALRGAGDTKTPMKAALIGPLVIRLSACWFLAYHMEMGLLGIWLGSTLDWLVRAVWLWFVFRKGDWKTIKV